MMTIPANENLSIVWIKFEAPLLVKTTAILLFTVRLFFQFFQITKLLSNARTLSFAKKTVKVNKNFPESIRLKKPGTLNRLILCRETRIKKNK